MRLSPTPLTFAALAALPLAGFAAPPGNSAYRTDTQYTHVEDATSRGVGTVNMITCIMSAMRPDALVNQGPYLALIDEGKCNNDERSSAANSSGSGSNAPSYLNAIVDSARASNDVPMRMRSWISMIDGQDAMTVFVNLSAATAPSEANPYGDFRIDYCGQPDAMPGACMMQGFVTGSADGIRFYEQEQGGGAKALALTRGGGDSGAGLLSFSGGSDAGQFSFAYNASLFLRSDGSSTQCFSRDASDPGTGKSVWRYGLYGSETGSAVQRNSGFPIEYASSGQTVHGYIGYWGLSVPGNVAAPANGSTVSKVDYADGQAPVKTDYTFVSTAGRLMKYGKREKTLAQIDKIRFNTWVSDATGFYSGATPGQYELYWDQASGQFKVTGTMDCTSGQCQTRDLVTEQPVSVDYFGSRGGARGWSQALGGELYIALQGLTASSVDPATAKVIYRVQDLVYPADMPASLHCISNCPSAASMAAYFGSHSGTSPYVPATEFRWMPATSLVDYSTANGLLNDGSADVVYTDRESLQQQPQYANGVRSGRLFTDASAVLCPGSGTQWCEYKVEELDDYYVWETGANAWNQFAALKTPGSNSFVAFDAPLNVDYTVPNDTAYGAYAGKSLVLQYGGFGDLWGLPGHCVSASTNATQSCDQPDSRYVAAFAIPFDETLGVVHAGATPYLVKWLDREIRFARKDPSVCSSAGLTLPSGLTLPTATDLQSPAAGSGSAVSIGTAPDMSGASPRVIHGEVKY